ncbi:MAG: carboxypeptidase [Acidobacteria bacterium]|nr:MAG: carboxypeptidase [Acidobacteriota bacterium]
MDKRTPPFVVCAVAVFGLLAAHAQAQSSSGWINAYRDTAARLIKAATADDFAWQRLAELTDTYGNRLSGSENLGRAIAWAAETMKKDGLDNVRTEKVMVPKWTRGRESAEIVDPPRHALTILGLGGTIATPPGGLEADVLVVESFNELRMRAADAKGKIVLFNEPFTNYADTVSYRTGSARAGAQVGAVGILVRSVGPVGLRTPHTGAVQYQADLPPIPAAAISGEDANRIARLAARGRKVRIRLSLDGHSEADVESANVIGEIRGREKPDEVVVLGGHIDSWDVGAGASDDGVGCVITWEALRLMKKLGIQPRRTVRLVLWTNEENGTRGAAAYADKYASTAMNHVFALEADSGVFEPARFGFSGSLAARNVIRDITSLLSPLNLAETISGGGGADIDPIAQAGRAPTMAYMGDPTRYFTIHHTPADTVERIAPEEVAKGAAAIAVVTYVIAEMPDRLPK